MILKLLAIHREFWEEQPALLIGLSFLVGIGAALFSLPLWIVAAWASYTLLLRKWASCCSVFFIGLYAWLLYSPLPTIDTPAEITAHFSISSLEPHQSPFYKDLLYRGTLYWNQAALPCCIYVRPQERIIASGDYQVTGTLRRRGDYEFTFRAKHWEPLPWTFSLAELRYQTKEHLRAFLKIHLPHSATLLSSLATGEVEDRLLRYEFSRLGLQHLLAISGFHFGVLLLFFSFLLGLFLSQRNIWIALFCLSIAYFLFIGSSPPVQRAWITLSLFLLSKLLKRPVQPINLLGTALVLELLWNPLNASHLSFQLSFASCFGILLFHSWIDATLCTLFPKRKMTASASLPLLAQATYLTSSLFRTAIGIGLAVNITLLPLLLYHFGKFPYLSLLYNLFYPFLLSFSLFGLLSALLIVSFLPAAGAVLFSLLDWFTKQLLDLTSYPPLVLDHSLYFLGLSRDWVAAYFFGLLGVGVYCFSLKEDAIV